jgi:NAD(P)-dependent dehydrogenase (short-subunit alcohol dehydrogenase family)
MKNILITGGTSGIGAAVVQKLDSYDSHLIILSRNKSGASNKFINLKSKITLIQCDLSQISKIEESLTEIPDRIDCFVHSAGISHTKPLNKLKQDIYTDVFNVNVFSFIEIMRIISIRKVKAQNYWTNVVAVSSVASKIGGVGQIVYAASKAALESAIRTLTKELNKKNIRLNGVRPGLVDTPMTLDWMETIGLQDINQLNDFILNGLAKPTEVADVICFLLSNESRQIMGQNITVDGGGVKNKLF